MDKCNDLEKIKEQHYQNYLKKSAKLNKIVDYWNERLGQYKVSNIGLVSEKIRLSPEYIKDNKGFKIAFKKLQVFNKNTKKEAKRQHNENKENRKKYGLYNKLN